MQHLTFVINIILNLAYMGFEGLSLLAYWSVIAPIVKLSELRDSYLDKTLNQPKIIRGKKS